MSRRYKGGVISATAPTTSSSAATGMWTMQRQLQALAGSGWPSPFTTVSGTLTGSGSLSIPAGATLVSLTGAGGTGGNDYWYDPGQEYIAPTPWSGHWTDSGAPIYGNYSSDISTGYPAPPTGPGQYSGAWVCSWTNIPPEVPWYCAFYGLVSVTDTPYDPGQPYIAPSSGGGPTYGPSTSATLNGTTRTWTGGYDSGVVGTSSTQTLTSTGAGQTLTYSVGAGGNLSYTYTY